MYPLRHILVIGCLIIWQSIVAQVVFENPLRDYAFLARTPSSNGAVYHVKGQVTPSTFNELRVAIYKDDSVLRVERVKLINNRFWLPLFLEAGKWQFKIECTFTGSTTFQQNFENILVGDVYLIQGQSNAVASDYRPWPRSSLDSVYQSPFLRSFGTSHTLPAYSLADTFWHLMTTDRVYSVGSVGQWGLVMASHLLDSFGIPICILNGAVGGTPVSYHIPDPKNHLNPQTNYGRLLTRVTKAGIENVRGIFYFQGESDGSNATKHDTMFRSIVKAWKQDYRGFEKLYVVQVREGCGGPSLQLREVQRQFGLTINECQTLTANGLNGHDGCHYNFDNGYKKLGYQISQIVGRDLYDSKRKHVDPLDIKHAVYSNSGGTEIQVHMQRSDDSVFVDTAFYTLFGIQGDANVRITSGELRNNSIYLKINQPSCKQLTLYYNGAARNQPWVRNSTEMGLLTFYGVPVKRHLPISPMFGCKGQTIELGSNHISGLTYEWKDKSTGRTYNTPKIQVTIQSDKVFELKIKGINAACTWYDSTRVYLYADSIILPAFDSIYKRCGDEKIELSPVRDNYKSMTWNGKIGFNLSTLDTGSFVWNGRSSNGCVYKDSFKIENSLFELGLPDSVALCTDSSVLLKVDSSFSNVKWNITTKANQYRTKNGIVSVMATNTDGCTDSFKVVVRNYPKMPIHDWNFNMCETEQTLIVKPKYVRTWYHFNNALQDTIILSSDTVLNISLIDQYSCPYRDKIELHTYPNPLFELPSDTGYCAGSGLSIPYDSTYKIYLNSTLQLFNPVQINELGSYSFLIKNEHDCALVKTVNIEEWPKPDLSMLKDTVICDDSVLTLELSNYNEVRINDSVRHDTLVHLEANRHYKIEVINDYQCSSSKTLTVDSKECTTMNLRTFSQGRLYLYPNPVLRNGLLHLFTNKQQISSAIIYSIHGDLVESYEHLRSDEIALELDYAGTYVLVVKLQNGQTTVCKFVVY